jgi:hypothetical protein
VPPPSYVLVTTHGVAVLTDRFAMRPVSPPWHPDALLVPFNVFYLQPAQAMLCDAEEGGSRRSSAPRHGYDSGKFWWAM